VDWKVRKFLHLTPFWLFPLLVLVVCLVVILLPAVLRLFN
jgi:hypothetical protein